MAGAEKRVLELSWQLDPAGHPDVGFGAMAAALAQAIPADALGLADASVAAGRLSLHGTDGMHPAQIIEPLARTLLSNPLYRSYAATPHDLSPRRVSDLVPLRSWRFSALYAELFVPMGARFQLGIGLRFNLRGRATGWMLNRTGHDFSDGDLEVAQLVQPLLAAAVKITEWEAARAMNQGAAGAVGAHGIGGGREIGRAGGRMSVDTGTRDRLRREQPIVPIGRAEEPLTSRETTMLGLLARGLSAQQIALVTRISPRTVAKHLEHVYAKLGVHDRLQAALAAERLGLVTPAAGSLGDQ